MSRIKSIMHSWNSNKYNYTVHMHQPPWPPKISHRYQILLIDHFRPSILLCIRVASYIYRQLNRMKMLVHMHEIFKWMNEKDWSCWCIRTWIRNYVAATILYEMNGIWSHKIHVIILICVVVYFRPIDIGLGCWGGRGDGGCTCAAWCIDRELTEFGS